MNTEKSCPNCGKPLPPDAPLGLCPECLIKSGSPTVRADVPGAGFVPPTVEDIAKLFPQFEILSFIGKGGMGAVYKGRQPALDRFIALKVLPSAVANDPGFAERFNREARALARLNHPNIVTVYDFGEVAQPSGQSPIGQMPPPLHYLLMEFVDGTNLREIERAGTLSPEQALAIVPQICDALQFAHNEGIVHRDIKPENLLLDRKGRLKITDFGIAKILGLSPDKTSLTGAKDVMGTPHYMAPEQIEKPQTVDHRADIYSLGVVFYEMLTGELPLGKFAPPSKKVRVDVRLDEVVLHTLEKEPERRYQNASQVKTDVQNITTTPPAMGFAGPASSIPSATLVPPGPETSDKIILPAFLLAFFFGVFGAHRYYTGKIWTGLLQLGIFVGSTLLTIAFSMTLGHSPRPIFIMMLMALICSSLAICISPIWAVVDWILILCKVFTDGRGRRITHWAHPDARVPQPEIKPPGGAPPTPQATGGKSPGIGTPPPMSPTPGGFPAAASTPNAMITAPAVGLMVVGALKLLGVVKNFALFHWGGAWLSSAIPGFGDLSSIHWNALNLFDSAFKTVAGLLIFFGGYQMFRRQRYAWAIAGGIFSIVACSLTSLPVGIWALIVLARDDVKAVFENSSAAAPSGGGRLPSWSLPVAIIACIVLFLAAVASLGFAAVRTIADQFGSSASSVSGPALQMAGIDRQGDEFRKNFSQSFPLDTNGLFSINDIDGGIEIHGWNSNVVALNAVIHGKTAESVAAAQIKVDSDPSRVAVHTVLPSRMKDVSSFSDWFKNDNGPASVEYTVNVPLHARLENVSNVNGAVAIDGMADDITASTVNGSAEVKNAAGNLKLSTVNGALTANLDKLGDGQFVALDTVNGQIKLELPDNADATFSIATFNGGISSDFPELTVKKQFPNSGKLSGSLKSGAASVKANTVNGAIEILKH